MLRPIKLAWAATVVLAVAVGASVSASGGETCGCGSEPRRQSPPTCHCVQHRCCGRPFGCGRFYDPPNAMLVPSAPSFMMAPMMVTPFAMAPVAAMPVAAYGYQPAAVPAQFTLTATPAQSPAAAPAKPNADILELLRAMAEASKSAAPSAAPIVAPAAPSDCCGALEQRVSKLETDVRTLQAMVNSHTKLLNKLAE